MTRTFNDNWAVRAVHTPDDAYATASVAGTWVNMQGFRRCIFIPISGALDGNTTVQVWEATSAAGANAQEIDTALRGTFTNGSDDALPGIIEIRDTDLTADYNYVTLYVASAGQDPFACVAILGEPYSAPVDNGSTYCAFNVGE